MQRLYSILGNLTETNSFEECSAPRDCTDPDFGSQNKPGWRERNSKPLMQTWQGVSDVSY